MRIGSSSKKEFFDGKHRLEHWYRDNTIYFLTTRCTNRFPAFRSASAKEVFWNQFSKYTKEFGFSPWITTLIDNHYHTIGHLPRGENLGPMMRKFHGSVAKLVNDLLPQKLLPFWSEYFDGCLRDETQFRRAYRYTLLQSVRHGICKDWRTYPHTRIGLPMEKGLAFAIANKSFLPMVPYQRYE